jgi:hypothetical protein
MKFNNMVVDFSRDKAEDLCLRAFAASMGDGSMFNAIYLDIRRLIRAKAEVMKAKKRLTQLS